MLSLLTGSVFVFVVIVCIPLLDREALQQSRDSQMSAEKNSSVLQSGAHSGDGCFWSCRCKGQDNQHVEILAATLILCIIVAALLLSTLPSVCCKTRLAPQSASWDDSSIWLEWQRRSRSHARFQTWPHSFTMAVRSSNRHTPHPDFNLVGTNQPTNAPTDQPTYLI